MSIEEGLLEAIDEDEEECGTTESSDWREKQRRRFQQKNRSAIDRFLGKGRRTNRVAILPRYYGELLTWALHRHLEREGWKTTATLGYRATEPVYLNVDTGGEIENLLMNGQMLVERGATRLIVTVDISLRWLNSVLVEGPAAIGREIDEFVSGVLATARERNFYRGKTIEFAGRLRFLKLKGRSWDSIILDQDIKEEIKANTVGFLSRGALWAKYGIPSRRGLLLAGEPGTGKTIICKALMAEAEGATCITTSAYALDTDDYVTELYDLAQDLSPCLVFIEDIDLIGQNREEFGYQRGNALLSLLSVLDGVEEKSEIVTVATTNCLEILDKALRQRPSRFDRVIQLTRPGLEQRRELVDCLCRRIPLGDDLQRHIAERTEGCTPAQVQEVVYSLVIGKHCSMAEDEGGLSNLRPEDVERAVSRLNGRAKRHLGFSSGNNHNGAHVKSTEVYL